MVGKNFCDPRVESRGKIKSKKKNEWWENKDFVNAEEWGHAGMGVGCRCGVWDDDDRKRQKKVRCGFSYRFGKYVKWVVGRGEQKNVEKWHYIQWVVLRVHPRLLMVDDGGYEGNKTASTFGN